MPRGDKLPDGAREMLHQSDRATFLPKPVGGRRPGCRRGTGLDCGRDAMWVVDGKPLCTLDAYSVVRWDAVARETCEDPR